MEQLPQIGAGLGLTRSGPQQIRQMLARLWHIVVKHKKGQQRTHPVGIHGGEQFFPPGDPQLPEKFHPDWLHSGMVLKKSTLSDRNHSANRIATASKYSGLH